MARNIEPFEFPQRISIYELDPDTITDYEVSAPGYGSSAGYVIADVHSRVMTAYAYDRTWNDIPDDVSDPSVRAEFERSTFEAFFNRDLYDEADVEEQGAYVAPSGQAFHYAVASLSAYDWDRPRSSMIALTTNERRYFKIRVSQPAGGQPADALKALLDCWGDYLWMLRP